MIASTWTGEIGAERQPKRDGWWEKHRKSFQVVHGEAEAFANPASAP